MSNIGWRQGARSADNRHVSSSHSHPDPAPAELSGQADDESRGHGLFLIVVGSSIEAERRDRPLAYRFREQVLDRLDVRRRDGEADALTPLVCSDLWYLNAREADGRPAIALGAPNTNAATALFSNRVPTAFVVEQRLRVHVDVEFIDLRAAIWGVNAAATASAIDLFAERYLGDFLDAA